MERSDWVLVGILLLLFLGWLYLMIPLTVEVFGKP